MIGLYAFLGAILFFLLLAVADRNTTRFSNRAVSKIGMFLHSSQQSHFALYFVSLSFIAISFNLLIRDIGSRFLSEAFTWPIQLLLWLNIALLMTLHNLGRFRWKLTEEGEVHALLEALEETVEKAPTPAEGFDHVSENIIEHQSQFPDDILNRLLSYVSQREDVIGKEAQERLSSAHEDFMDT